MSHSFTESTIEQATIDWLKDLGYTYAFGLEIAFDSDVCTLVSLSDVPSMLGKGEVRMKDVEVGL